MDINWEPIDPLLGKQSDNSLSRQFNVPRTYISEHRRKLGIAAYQPLDKFASVRDRIGKVDDKIIAAEVGCSVAAVAHYRDKNGINSHRRSGEGVVTAVIGPGKWATSRAAGRIYIGDANTVAVYAKEVNDRNIAKLFGRLSMHQALSGYLLKNVIVTTSNQLSQQIVEIMARRGIAIRVCEEKQC